MDGNRTQDDQWMEVGIPNNSFRYRHQLHHWLAHPQSPPSAALHLHHDRPAIVPERLLVGEVEEEGMNVETTTMLKYLL